ncbi:hypothetical protein BaRGS_00020422 [Batillaria attramentaria]|uniref:Uncharacterized protein n=1 Tax=Batillaria attramentaria TaxID=370345 RepID=A0ABD0KMZ3_9CAEN
MPCFIAANEGITLKRDTVDRNSVTAPHQLNSHVRGKSATSRFPAMCLFLLEEPFKARVDTDVWAAENPLISPLSPFVGSLCLGKAHSRAVTIPPSPLSVHVPLDSPRCQCQALAPAPKGSSKSSPNIPLGSLQLPLTAP